MDNNTKVFETLQLQGKPMRAGEIAEMTGIDKKDVEKVIKSLVKEEKIHSPIRCFYGIK
jgi:predicted transcriptional regulator